MSDLNKLKELAKTVDFWGSATGWQPDQLHETIHFALKQAERLEAVETEIARRDKAAGEPVYQVGTDGHWYDCKEYIYREAKERREACRILYTAAQPAALPPEYALTVDFNDYHLGWNSCLNAAKALGCKAIKLPKIKHPAQFDYADDVIATLKAQGLSVEGDDDE